jgi:alcohol dehydrogenase, propanol-preferring
MKAMVLRTLGAFEEGARPLSLEEVPTPVPGEGEFLLRTAACGVCHTELDEIEGRTPPPRLPVILGHQAVGRVAAVGPGVRHFKEGDRAGVAWVFSACGACALCRKGLENLCARFRATGRDADGGYAEYVAVREDFAYPIPDAFTDVQAAPLLCAGAIGYRSLALAGLENGQSLGLTGFGASGHLVLKMASRKYPGSKVYVFARSESERTFARELGAVWAGDTSEEPPEKLRAIIDTTPAWRPVLEALGRLEPGGRLVINAIRKEEGDKSALLGLNYASHLWMEKEIKSVANVARSDVRDFLSLAAEAGLKPEVQEYRLEAANEALWDLKSRKARGAKVLVID